MKPVAIIDGGLGATGRAIATALATHGYTLALTYFGTEAAEARRFVDGLPGGPHLARKVDITDAEAVAAFVDEAAGLGTIEACIHVACDPIARKTLSAMNDEEFRSQFEATVFGAHTVFAATLPRLKTPGGLLLGITTSFIESGQGAPRMGGYISAKYALRGLLRELARETSASGIRVNAIAPDLMQTKLSGDLPGRFFEWAAERDARGRLTTPTDVAEKVLYLLSGGGASLNNVSIPITGAPTPL